MLSSSSVVIEIGHYSEQTETPDPTVDMRETILIELCMSLIIYIFKDSYESNLIII